MFHRIKERLKNISFIRIAMVFYKSVFKGYQSVCRIRAAYGEDAAILSCCWTSTGDFYLMGMYLEDWLARNGVSHYVILAGAKSEQRVVNLLFPKLCENRCELIDYDSYARIMHMNIFLRERNSGVHCFNDWARICSDYSQHLYIYERLKGYKGLTLSNFYQINMGITAGSPISKPAFQDKKAVITKIFKINNLKRNKTVLIAPYSPDVRIPDYFWGPLVATLKKEGYTVCTNCFGNEPPLEGTKKLSLSYYNIVPFLEVAGVYIGIRNGLADIISSAKCIKLIVHPYHIEHVWLWPTGKTLDYVGLNNMGLCADAHEFELTENNGNLFGVQKRIIKSLHIPLEKALLKPVIKINFADVPLDFDPQNNRIVNILEKKYTILITDQPDFLFYSVFGGGVLYGLPTFTNYHNCVKIFFTGEAVSPNFNECDYAMAYDFIEFGDRYLRGALGDSTGIGYQEITPALQIRKKVNSKLFHRKFCNFVYSQDDQGEGAAIRVDFCKQLMKYKHVDCPGRILRNMPEGSISARWVQVPGKPDSVKPDWTQGKLAFIKNYKFTLAFENARIDGYTTEKIIHAFMSYSIPVYWGNPSIVKEFNPKAFINCNDYDTFDEVIERIIELDNDKEKYLEMLRQPPLQPTFDYHLKEKQEQFILNIIAKGNHPFIKDPLSWTSTNAMRNAISRCREAENRVSYIESTNSWKIMRKLQIFFDSKWGRLPKKMIKPFITMVVHYFERQKQR